jgi:hypothetical protein
MPPVSGRNYQSWLSQDQDRQVQETAVELSRQGKLVDERNRPVKLRTVHGKKEAPRYSICKIALLRFAETNGRETPQVVPSYSKTEGSEKDA